MLHSFSSLFRKNKAAGILQAVVGAAASLKLALQYGIDLANKAGLFVFCIASEMSWQFWNNIEELHISTSPKYSHMVIKVLSRACTVFSSNLPTPTPKRGCKASFQVSDKLQILECESEGQGRQEWLSHGTLKVVLSKYGRTMEGLSMRAGALAALSSLLHLQHLGGSWWTLDKGSG